MTTEPSAEWLRMAAEEPYRVGARLGDDGTVARWMVYDVREETGAPVATRKTRDAAVRLAEQMNTEHRRWFA